MRRFAEDDDPVVVAVPATPPALGPVQHLLQRHDAGRLREGVGTECAGQQLVRRLAPGRVEVGEADPGAGLRPVLDPPAGPVVVEVAARLRRQGIVQPAQQLTGVPPEAWTYQLGNRSALEWILDQYKEKTPKDPTIREKFNTYRFADHKEKVIDLLKRVTRVSVETMKIVEAMGTEKH